MARFAQKQQLPNHRRRNFRKIQQVFDIAGFFLIPYTRIGS
jgi:hypothetical protein